MEEGFEFAEGPTGDLTFVARSATVEGAFRAAARALLAATVEEPDALRRRENRSVALEEPDLELLLLRFLNELVYLRDAEELLLVPDEIAVERNGTVRLVASLSGERIDPARHRLAAEVKAATAHGLRVTSTPGGWTATFTLDV